MTTASQHRTTLSFQKRPLHDTPAPGAAGTAAFAYELPEPARFTSARARWSIHGTGYEVPAEELPASVARSFLEHPEAEVVLAARPFTSDAPTVLIPGAQCADDLDHPSDSGASAPVTLGHGRSCPPRREFEERVAEAVTAMREAEDRLHEGIGARDILQKVVLGRRLLFPIPAGMTPSAVGARLQEALVDGPGPGYGFSLPISHGGSFIGRSPELLLSRTGQMVETTPLAGSAPRTGNPGHDERAARQLLSSAKDLREHRYVVEHVVEQLQAVCTEISAPESPDVFETATMLHLGTPIRGTLADTRNEALAEGPCYPGVFDLAELLHPTPAVCGAPTRAAREAIREMEEPRGYFTGLVGWQDRAGDGETVVAIRCAEITPEAVEVFAGAGIISDSVPSDEAEETWNKMRTVLRALGEEHAVHGQEPGRPGEGSPEEAFR